MKTLTVPTGSRGPWKIERFEVSERDAEFSRLRAGIKGQRRLYVPAGTYTRLVRDGQVWMSDTPAEVDDLYDIIDNARGHVLVNGLGLGIVLHHILPLDRVDAVTVIEIDADVISLVGDHYVAMGAALGKKVEIIHDDATTWKPKRGTRYGYVWHDIWPSINADHLPEMNALLKRYRNRCDAQWCWARREHL